VSARGDIVTVALPGAYGKPRPAVVIQADLLDALDSVVICPLTSDIRDLAVRPTIEPAPSNGLGVTSQVMADKISTVPRSKAGPTLGRLSREQLVAVERALLVVVGIA